MQLDRKSPATFEPLEPRKLFAAAPLFTVDTLVSDNTKTIPAAKQDPLLVNAWGIANGPGTQNWVADTARGKVTAYDGNGKISGSIVSIPSPLAEVVEPPVTGVAYNSTKSFNVATKAPAMFIFVTEDGTISGWSNNADPNNAILKVNNSGAAVYTGVTTDSVDGNNYILATNFESGKIEVYDTNFNLAHLSGSFKDSQIPAGYAPLGIQNINGLIYVTYAAQNASKNADAPGAGHGYVDVYLPDGTLDHRLIKRGTLDSPYGIARIPGGFGKYKRDIAIGNSGNGVIQVFDPSSGAFLGDLDKTNGKTIVISGLRGLTFGNDGSAGSSSELFFTSGPNGGADGLYGKLVMSTAAAKPASVAVPRQISVAELFSAEHFATEYRRRICPQLHVVEIIAASDAGLISGNRS